MNCSTHHDHIEAACPECRELHAPETARDLLAEILSMAEGTFYGEIELSMELQARMRDALEREGSR